jgi:hypothetical protein
MLVLSVEEDAKVFEQKDPAKRGTGHKRSKWRLTAVKDGSKETRRQEKKTRTREKRKKEEAVFGSRCIKQGLVVCCTLLVRN